MLQRTSDYFETVFADFYANNPDVDFLGIESAIDFTLYAGEAGRPEERFNIYINFSFSDLTFTEDSIPPTTAEALDILYSAISPTYILEVVRTFEGTPWVSTSEVFFAAP